MGARLCPQPAMPFFPSAFEGAQAGAKTPSPCLRLETPGSGIPMTLAREALFVAEEAREELATLRDCLVACGVLSRERLEAEKHRRRFRAAASASNGWSCILGASLEDLSRGPLTRIACLLGPQTGSRFRCTSTAVESACLKASAMYGPRFYVWGGFTGEANLESGESLDLGSGQWESLPPLAVRRAGGGCATVGHQIYVAGGFDGHANRASADRFDPATSQWEALPDMSSRRFGCSAVDYGGSFCVCGGNDGQVRLETVECFLPSQGTWRMLPQMSVQRIGAVAAALGGRLFVCGGQDLKSAESFDKGRWARIPPMSAKRFGASGGACAGCIYVCGGKGTGQPNLNSVERFVPSNGCWEELAPMMTRRFGAAAASIQGKLYVFGGNDLGIFKFGGTRLTSAECFCTETGEWEELPPLREGRSGPFVAAVVQQAWQL